MNYMSTAIRPSFLDGKPKKLLIDGQWVEAVSGETFHTFNPTTGEQLDPLAKGGAADIDRAVLAARRAFEEGPWRKFTPADRQLVLLKLADLIDERFDELYMIDTLEMGAPIAAKPWLKKLILGTYRFHAGMAAMIEGETVSNSLGMDIHSQVLREPVGVVGGIIAWNGPVFNATWKIAPILSSGCTLVLKCAEQACLSPLLLGQLCLEAGVPPGVVNIVTGFGDAGAALSSHPDVDKIAFTGSTETAQHIIRASAVNVKRLTLELGGKSPNIVFADADLDAAVPGAAMAVFANTGQVCSAGSRLFVERSIYEEFTHKVAEFAKTLRVGDPMDPETNLGPLASEEHLDRVSGFFSTGAMEGAKPLIGGERLLQGNFANGYFVPPTLFTDVRDDMTIARDEIFGPVISALPFDDVEEVVKRANQTRYGLGSGVWTRDISKANFIARELRAGSVWVNCYQAMDPAVPFGGYKMSGYGSEGGKRHLDGFLTTKSVWIR